MLDFLNYRKVNVDENVIPIELSIEGLANPESDITSYESLKDKPMINGHVISRNMTNTELGIPTKMSDLEDDGTYVKEQVQSDWNENEKTSPAYVKNRPFYINDRVKDKSILDGAYTIRMYTEIGTGYKATTDTLLVAYNKYKITWDSTVYYMTALPAGGSRVYIGDINVAPFFRIETYQTTEGEKYIVVDYPSDVDSVHSISLSSLKSKPVSTEEFDNYVINLITARADSAIVDQSKIIDGNTVGDAIYLRSPNKVWKITMTDSGEFNISEV